MGRVFPRVRANTSEAFACSSLTRLCRLYIRVIVSSGVVAPWNTVIKPRRREIFWPVRWLCLLWPRNFISGNDRTLFTGLRTLSRLRRAYFTSANNTKYIYCNTPVSTNVTNIIVSRLARRLIRFCSSEEFNNFSIFVSKRNIFHLVSIKVQDLVKVSTLSIKLDYVLWRPFWKEKCRKSR